MVSAFLAFASDGAPVVIGRPYLSPFTIVVVSGVFDGAPSNSSVSVPSFGHIQVLKKLSVLPRFKLPFCIAGSDRTAVRAHRLGHTISAAAGPPGTSGPCAPQYPVGSEDSGTVFAGPTSWM